MHRHGGQGRILDFKTGVAGSKRPKIPSPLLGETASPNPLSPTPLTQDMVKKRVLKGSFGVQKIV